MFERKLSYKYQSADSINNKTWIVPRDRKIVYFERPARNNSSTIVLEFYTAELIFVSSYNLSVLLHECRTRNWLRHVLNYAEKRTFAIYGSAVMSLFPSFTSVQWKLFSSSSGVCFPLSFVRVGPLRVANQCRPSMTIIQRSGFYVTRPVFASDNHVRRVLEQTIIFRDKGPYRASILSLVLRLFVDRSPFSMLRVFVAINFTRDQSCSAYLAGATTKMFPTRSPCLSRAILLFQFFSFSFSFFFFVFSSSN